MIPFARVRRALLKRAMAQNQLAPVRDGSFDSGVAATCRRKVALRLLPFLSAAYLVAYLDRANVGFANAYMSSDLRFSDAVFGFGAGVFFLGYFLLEIPGALIVERWSARRWISRILVTWGLCTTLMALIKTPGQFYAARFLIGCAEAGFYPGVIVYLTHWFTERDRARAAAAFVIAAPVSLTIGAPLSAAILHLPWPVMAQWRWLFIVQGLPAVALGFVAWRYLTDRPQSALWLAEAERRWLTQRLQGEARQKPSGAGLRWWSSLRNRHVLLLAGAHLLANVAGYSFIFWLPSNLRETVHLSPELANLAAALPFAFAVLALWLAARSSDRSEERKLHACVPMAAAALCIAFTAIPHLSAALSFTLLTLTGAALFAWIPGFWALPAMSFSGDAAAASIGFINAIGNLGGFLGPSLTGVLRTSGRPRLAFAAVIAIAYAGAATLTWLAPAARNKSA
jgi:MFS transporter, ACS family, tartrate transporter